MARYERPNEGNGCAMAIIALLLSLFGPFLLELAAFIILMIIVTIASR